MESPNRKRWSAIILLIVGTVFLAGGFALWALYRLFPTWFPPWFDKLFAILAGLGVLITVVGAALSDIFLPLLDRLRGRDGSGVWRLAEKTPIRRVEYDALVARLGRSGKIPWIDRDRTSVSLLREHGRVAIAGWMKSGKTREAAELIRRTLEDGWISQVYEPTSALDLIDQEALASAIATEVDSRQRCLFLIDELGLRPDVEGLKRLSTCIETISKVRPDAYFLITIQRERLISQIRAWLEDHQFYLATLSTLTAVQRRELARTAAEVLEIPVTDDAIAVLVSETDGRPYSIVFALQQASGAGTLSEDSVRELLTRSEKEAWAEQRRHVSNAEPLADVLLQSIVTFMSSGVTPGETSIRHYARYLMTYDSVGRETVRLLDAAAERWSTFDIVATGGLYTVPEPLLLPLLIDVDEARARLSTFCETHNPGFWLSFATAILRPIDVLLRLKKSQLPGFRLLSELGSRLRSGIRSLRFPRARFILRLRTELRTAIERLFPSPDIVLRLSTWLTETLFSWPADRALLLSELGSEPKRTEYLSSNTLTARGEHAAFAGNHTIALDCLDKALALNTTNSRAQCLRGITYGLMGRYEEALADFDRAIELDPDYARAVASRGVTYRLMERYEEALADFDRAIDLDFAWAITRRGEIYRQMERYEEALTDFDRVIDLDPDNDWVLYGRALTRQALGQAGEAQQDFTAAIGRAQEAYKEDPEDWNNTLNLALYYLASEEAEEAERHYRAVLSGDALPFYIRMAVRDLNDFLALFPDHSQAVAMRDGLQQHLEEVDE